MILYPSRMKRFLSDRALRWLAFGASVGGVAAFAWTLSILFRSWLHAPAIVSPLIAAALLIAAKPLLARIERWATAAPHGTAASVMTAGLAPVFAWAAYASLADPIINSSRDPIGRGLGVTIGVFAALLLLGVAFGAIGALSRGQLGRMRDGMLTFFAVSALGVGAGLATWASLRLVTHPSLDAYLGSAHEAVVVPRAEEPITPGASAGLGPSVADTTGLVIGPDGPQAAPASHVDKVSLDEQTGLRRQCQEGACSVDLHPLINAPGAPIPGHAAAGFPAHARLHASALPAERLWLVQSGERRAAFRARTFERVDVSALDLAGSIAATPLLVFASVLGVALAWLALARRESLVERLMALDGAREALLDESGWLAFADGAPPSRAVEPLPPAGPVLVLSPRTGGASTYRSAIGLEEHAPLLPGTRADARAEVDAAIAGRFAAALAAIAVLSAPLAVFALAAFFG